MIEPQPVTSRRRRFSVDALFTDTSRRAIGVADLLEAKQIQIERIEADPNQPRTGFDRGALEELAASIRTDGILQPIAVRYDEPNDVYVIVHGERRWRAAMIAGLASVPAIVRDVPEDRRLIQQLVENIAREDLNALDRSAALRALKERMGDAPWEQVAAAVGIRRSRLFQLLSTEKLDPVFQDALRRGVISEKQTRAVQGLSIEAQRSLAESLLEGDINPRDLEAAARAMKRPNVTVVPPSADQLAQDASKHARSLSSTLERLERSHASLTEKSTNQLVADLRDLESRMATILTALGDR
ncbi:MAG TPA: ParB/RepB/Spo0J family partition protein [Thermomicrobiales bacterium]|nr:ParB/RepB/Spo0J family partition protein [Thermomicrobiales bacterium]